MNNLKSYTEYAVTTPTTDFVIGFDFNYGTDAVNVTVDDVPATEAGYSVIYLNSTTMRLSPAVPSGVVRLQRETDIDVPDNQFTAGAKFIASNMDENFTQLRHAQQEVRDGFEKLSDDTYEIIDTLQVVGQAAQDAADAAEQAAQTANDAAAQVNDKVSYQDLDNAIAATPHNNLKDRDAAGAHLAIAITDASGKTQQDINNYRPTALQLESIGSDGILNASTGLQALATSVDLGLKPYIFLPFYNNNYKLDSTVVIQEPMMLWGDAVPTYNRGDGKKGKILLNTPIGFNLGNGRTNGAVLDLVAKTSKNGADQWTIKNLAFLPFNRAEQQYTQTAIMFDSKNNGPDRGFIMREVSASRVKHAIHVKDNDVQTHLSNLEVVNCCFSNNLIPILADGNVWCGRIVNSQIEQNYEGAIHGVFHAGLTIHDNMLEGCRNTIYIKDHPRDHDGCYLSLQRNYFEGNSGDYLVKMDSFQANSIISRGNYASGFMSADGITPNTDRKRPTDHFLLTNSYSSIYIYDSLSVSFFGLVACAEDNNLKKFLVYAKPEAFVKVNTRLNDAKEMGVNVASVRNIANKVNTDVGEVYEVGKSNQYTDIPLSVNANDVVQLVFSYYSDDDALAPSLITIIESGTSVALVQGAGIPPIKSQGNIKTVNLVFTVPYNATGNRAIRFNLTTTDPAKTLNMIGASAKKIGTYNASAVNPIDNRFIVEKSKPVLRRVVDGLKYSDILAESTIANGATLTKTYTVSGATSSNRVEAVLSSYLADLSVIARVSAANTIQVSIKNNGTKPITIPNTTELAYTIY